jgi:hypothetical protein
MATETEAFLQKATKVTKDKASIFSLDVPLATDLRFLTMKWSDRTAQGFGPGLAG